MRQQHDVFHVEQHRAYRGLLFENIETRAGDFAVLQRRHQGRFVDDVAARGIDQEGARFHRLERVSADQVISRLAARAMQGNEIRLREHVLG